METTKNKEKNIYSISLVEGDFGYFIANAKDNFPYKVSNKKEDMEYLITNTNEKGNSNSQSKRKFLCKTSNRDLGTINEAFIDDYPMQVSIEGTKTIIQQMKNSICHIITGSIKGTGFFFKVKNPQDNKLISLLITNYHILNDEYLKKSKSIKIFLNEKKKITNIQINNINDSRKIYTNKILDITFIEIKEKDNLNIQYLEIEENLNQEINDFQELYKKKPLYVLHYPDDKKLVSYGILRGIKSYDIYHTCSTRYGSSGGPIILIDSFKVIGIHKGRPENTKI